jgi:hypothetical protein
MGVTSKRHDAPAHIRDAIDELGIALGEASEVASAALYGSFVRGGYNPAGSDINLAVVVRSDDLESLARPLQAAWRAARIDPWIAREDELSGIADAFATRIRDIQRTHEILVGDDPWSKLTVPAPALRLRLEQELRNHQLRLRRARVLGDPASRARQLYIAAGALRLELSLLEELAGGGVHEAIEPLALAIATRLDLTRADVNSVLDYKVHPGADPRQLLAAVARLLDRAVTFVDSMEVT